MDLRGKLVLSCCLCFGFLVAGCWLLVALLVHLRLTVVCLLCGFIFSSVVLANVELLFAIVIFVCFVGGIWLKTRSENKVGLLSITIRYYTISRR